MDVSYDCNVRPGNVGQVSDFTGFAAGELSYYDLLFRLGAQQCQRQTDCVIEVLR